MMRRWLVVILFLAWTPLVVASSYIFTSSAPYSIAFAAPSPSPSDPSAGATCDAGSMTWAICPIISGAADLVDGIMKDIIQPFLQVSPLTQTVAGGGANPSYTIWQNFRNVASVMMILVFFAIIFGTAVGFDNYTIKKTMPHLIAGAILIPFSWYICVIMVDIGNVIGQGMLSLMDSFIPKPNVDFSSSLSQIMGLIGGGIALIALKKSAADMGLALVITILLAVLATMFTLVLRQILIILLVVLSPFAFLAWILPNTEKLFDQWWKNLTKLILMYPLVMLIFEAGRIFADTASATFGTGGGGHGSDYFKAAAVPFLELAGLFLPLASVPWTYKWAGGAMAAGAGAIGRAGGALNKRWGRGSDFDKKRAEKRAERGAASYVGKPISKLGQRMQARDENGNLKHKGLAAMSRMGGSYRAGQGLGIRVKKAGPGEGVGVGRMRFAVRAGQQNATQKRQMESTFSKAVEAEKGVMAAERIRQNEIDNKSYKGFHDTIASEASRTVAEQRNKARAAQAAVFKNEGIGLTRMQAIAAGEDAEHKSDVAREAAIAQLAGPLDESTFLRERVARPAGSAGSIAPEMLRAATQDQADFTSKNRDLALALDKGTPLEGSVWTHDATTGPSEDEVNRVAERQKELSGRKPGQVLSMSKHVQREYVDRAFTLTQQEEFARAKAEAAPGDAALQAAYQKASDARKAHLDELKNNFTTIIQEGHGGELDPAALYAVRDGKYKFKNAAGHEVEHELGFAPDQKAFIDEHFIAGAPRAKPRETPVVWAGGAPPPPPPPPPS